MATETIPDPAWIGLAPTLAFGVAALALLVWDMIDTDSRNRPVMAGIAGLGAVGALAGAGYFAAVTDAGVALFDAQLVADGSYWFFSVVFASVTLLVVVASYDYLRDHEYQAEYYALVLMAATGMTLMAAANSLVTVFVSLELASLPSYALVAFLKDNKGSVEGGLKYFLVGALSSAVFAYGVSLVYGATGVLQLDAIAAATAGTDVPGVLGLGIVMVVGGFAFKTASVPFHFWAPEAYEGAPGPISGFLSSASKAAGFAVAFRVFTTAFYPSSSIIEIGAVDWVVVFQILAVVTMVVGNFAAAVQEKVKRMLAYSSIGHAGYALIGLAALQGDYQAIVLAAAMMHLLVYGFMNTGAFLFISMGEYWDLGRTFADYNGLSRRAPMAALAMTVFMFSLAGLPPFGGFLSKYVLFMGAIRGGLWWLAAVGAITSALSLYYYTKMVKAMWVEPIDDSLELRGQPRGLYAAVMVAALMTVLLLPLFGVGYESATAAAEALLAAA